MDRTSRHLHVPARTHWRALRDQDGKRYREARKPTVNDASIQARDKDNCTVYRTRRGLSEPVYDIPNGFGLLDRMREPRGWRCYFRAEQHLVADWLNLLGHRRQLFVALTSTKPSDDDGSDRLRCRRQTRRRSSSPGN
jgi:hypothetical protein